MFKFVSNATQVASKWVRTIPTPIWAILVAPAVAIAGTEIQKFIDTRSFPEIDKNRIKVLDGRWGGIWYSTCHGIEFNRTVERTTHEG